MPTDEQISKSAGQMWVDRWTFVKDMNGDGAVTISDVWATVIWIVFAPGDAIILSVMSAAPAVARFLEIDGTWLFSWKSGVLSFFCIFIAFALYGALLDLLERSDWSK